MALTNSERVQAWRKRAKLKLVEIAGNQCQLCGYNKCITALEFHHINPSEKDFAVTGSRDTRNFATMVAEIRKCILVCANCHREIHYGLIDGAVLQSRQYIDEAAAIRYTSEVEAAKLSGRFQKDRHNDKNTRSRIKDTAPRPDSSSKCKKVDWSQHNVFDLLDEHKSYEAVGRLLGVTGAAIKRRKNHLLKKQIGG